jgi:hypothetical protein
LPAKRQRRRDALHCLKDACPRRVLRALRDFARDYCRAQSSLRSIIRWFHFRVFQEQEYSPSVMLHSDPIKHALIIGVAEDSVTQLEAELLFDFLSTSSILRSSYSSGPVVLP